MDESQLIEYLKKIFNVIATSGNSPRVIQINIDFDLKGNLNITELIKTALDNTTSKEWVFRDAKFNISITSNFDQIEFENSVIDIFEISIEPSEKTTIVGESIKYFDKNKIQSSIAKKIKIKNTILNKIAILCSIKNIELDDVDIKNIEINGDRKKTIDTIIINSYSLEIDIIDLTEIKSIYLKQSKKKTQVFTEKTNLILEDIQKQKSVFISGVSGNKIDIENIQTDKLSIISSTIEKFTISYKRINDRFYIKNLKTDTLKILASESSSFLGTLHLNDNLFKNTLIEGYQFDNSGFKKNTTLKRLIVQNSSSDEKGKLQIVGFREIEQICFLFVQNDGIIDLIGLSFFEKKSNEKALKIIERHNAEWVFRRS